jgi:hypothetical protein
MAFVLYFSKKVPVPWRVSQPWEFFPERLQLILPFDRAHVVTMQPCTTMTPCDVGFINSHLPPVLQAIVGY